MQAQASGDKAEIRQAYVPALRTQLLKPLLERGSDAIPEVRGVGVGVGVGLGARGRGRVGCEGLPSPPSQVIAMLDEYQLTKDDFDAIMELELLTGAGAKPGVAALPAAVKSALTRKYNQAPPPRVAPPPV